MTPSSSKTRCSVPSTVSTVNSSQPSIGSTQTSFMTSPPESERSPDRTNLTSVKKKLPVMDPPLPINTRFTDDDPNVPNSHKLPHGALCNPNEIRAAVFPGMCFGCKRIFKECLEKKYRDLCLHAVKNLIDEYGYQGVTDFSARKVFHNEYMANIRRDLKEATGFYECDHLLDLPMCMVCGSLKDTLDLIECTSERGQTIMAYLQDQCMSRIADHLHAQQDEKAFMEQAKKMAREEWILDEKSYKRRMESMAREEK